MSRAAAPVAEDRDPDLDLDLVIVGAGGFARETAQAVLAGASAPDGGRWRLLGHLDDDPALHGTLVDGVPVLGGCELARRMPAARAVLCVGSPRDQASRARLARRLALPPYRWATIVHPSASVAASASLGPGSVLLAGCVLTAAVRLGAHVAVMPHVVLTHDDTVADFATLASGVRLGGGVRVGRGAYVGAGALVREFTALGAWSLTGMGSVVLTDVPAGEVWAGSPARRLRPSPAPALAELSRGVNAPGDGGDGADPAAARRPVAVGSHAAGTSGSSPAQVTGAASGAGSTPDAPYAPTTARSGGGPHDHGTGPAPAAHHAPGAAHLPGGPRTHGGSQQRETNPSSAAHHAPAAPHAPGPARTGGDAPAPGGRPAPGPASGGRPVPAALRTPAASASDAAGRGRPAGGPGRGAGNGRITDAGSTPATARGVQGS